MKWSPSFEKTKNLLVFLCYGYVSENLLKYDNDVLLYFITHIVKL